MDGLQGLVLDGMGSVGANIVVSSTFDATTGWFTGTVGGSSTAVISGGLLTITGDGTNAAYAYQNLTTVVGDTYKLEVAEAVSNTLAVAVGTSALATDIQPLTPDVVPTGLVLYFRAVGTTTFINLRRTSVGAGSIGSITVQPVSGIHATSSGAARPTLRLTSGRYSSQYAGAQSLTLGSVPFQMSDDHFVIAAGRIDNGAVPTQTLFGCANSSTANPLVGQLSFNLTGVTGNMRDNAGTLIAAGTGTLAIGETFVGSLIRTTGSVLVRKNGVSGTPVSTTGLGATTLTTATIGASTRTTVVSAVTGAVGPVIIGKGTLTAAEALTLERFVASLTPSAPSF